MTNKKKRTTLAKAKRIAAGEASRKLASVPTTRECHLKATKAGDMIMFETRTGYFSPRKGPVFAVHELEVVEAHDNANALVELVMKAGISTLAALFRVEVGNKNGNDSIKGLAEAAAKWMKIDVEALRKEIEADRAEETPQAAAASREIVASELPADERGPFDDLHANVNVAPEHEVIP